MVIHIIHDKATDFAEVMVLGIVFLTHFASHVYCNLVVHLTKFKNSSAFSVICSNIGLRSMYFLQ